MIFLFLSICASVLIANLLMLFGRDKQADILLIFVGNYFVAAGVRLAGTDLTALPVLGWTELALAGIAGFLFLADFYTYNRNIGVNGMSLSVGVMRGAVIIPILFSAIVFAEKPGLPVIAGIVILLIAFRILTGKQKLMNILWILLLFVITGLTDISMKIFSAWGKAPQNLFLYVLFSFAFVFTLIWYLQSGRKAAVRNLFYGFVLGIPNQLSSLFFLKGLDSVPATIAFPLVSSGIVTLSILTDALIWKKRFTGTRILALILLILGIVLINLR